MVEIFEEYLRMDVIDFIYAFLLTSFIFLSVHFYKRYREKGHSVKTLTSSLEEAELDRASLMADSMAEDGVQEMFKIETDSNNTRVQQELEEYLVKEDEDAQEATQNFVEISADFVDFLKVKSGKIKLEESAFTVNDMLDDLAKSLRSQMARTKVELIFDIDTKVPPKLIGDKRHIRLLLFNVLSNIIHHQSDTQVVLHATSIKEDNALKLLFSVQECMLEEGFSSSDALFVPFSDSTFDESMKIELYIARELSRMMQGDITLGEDEAGKNEFKIELVLTESNPEDKRFYRLPSLSMTGRKILIVNSNKRLAKSIQSMYEYFKNEVTVIFTLDLVSNPEIIREFHTVLIEKDALDLSLVEKIRAIKRAHQVNVVALLQAKDEIDYQVPLGAVDRLLIKPVNIQSVFNTIVTLEENKETSGTDKASGEEQPTGKIDKKVFEDYSGSRILVIENERDNQKAIFSLLRRSGVNLTLAKSSQESLWMFEKMPVFDLILIGVEIDRETSLHLSQKIRDFGRYKGVPIIIMSKDKIADNGLGMDQYMRKPVQATELNTFFNHYLNKESTSPDESERYRPKAAFINTISLAARDGFEMASSDEELYSEILREFITLYSDSFQQMSSVMVKDDLEELKQLCLDIKGVTANIGALRLASITTQIHAAISKGKSKYLMSLMNQYQPELERVKKEIQAYLK